MRNVATILNRATLPDRTYDAEECVAVLQGAVDESTWFGQGLAGAHNRNKLPTTTVTDPAGERSFFTVDGDSVKPRAQARRGTQYQVLRRIHSGLGQHQRRP